ncbi:MAG TPA: hypothetical protein VGX76_12595, partial [Pirellulales bacterium]|nr:hypothetical protein [Pirellulales bacterium]
SSSSVYAGSPNDGSGKVHNFFQSGNTWNAGFTVASPGGSQFGAFAAIAALGDRLLIGAPGGSGVAYLYSAAGVSQNLTLQPFKFNSANGTTVADTDNVNFGKGASIIGDGFQVVGDGSGIVNDRFVYDFRQRGPVWLPNGLDLNTPAPLQTAKMGSSVAIVGDTAVLGAPQFGNRGAVLVFKNQNAGTTLEPDWQLQAQIDSPGFETSDRFGASVALSGDDLIVGAPGRRGDTGAAYIFHRLNGQWTLAQEFDGLVPGERSGTSVAIGPEYAVLGAAGSSPGATGAVYLFRKIAGVWTPDAKLLSPRLGDRFGTAVQLDASSLFVGAPGSATLAGAVYFYSLEPHPQNVASNVTAGPTTLPATGGAAGDQFGASLGLSGGYLVVGAPGTASQTGAAYVFARPTATTTWIQTRLDYSSGAVVGDQFGTSVAIDGTQIIVGAPGRIPTTADGKTYTQGEAFSYGLKSNGQWTLETPADQPGTHVLTGAAAAAGDNVGYAVAVSGDFALIGAPQLMGRPSGANSTDGGGYAFVRKINPPGNKILPELQTQLVTGAKTNTIAGTLGGNPLATLQFFDIAAVTLQTSSASVNNVPIVSSVTVQPAGFTAFGLQSFVATGNITYTNHAPGLKMPTDGLFDYVATVAGAGTSPIALDLNGNGLEFVPRSSTGPKFDLSGTGVREATSWLAPGDGWLFVDLNGGGQVTRSEMSFASTVPSAS